MIIGAIPDKGVFYVPEKRITKFLGKDWRTTNSIDRWSALGFSDGGGRLPFTPSDRRRVVINGEALMLLLLFHGFLKGARFSLDDLRKFFPAHTNDLNAAERYIEHVAVPILAGQTDDIRGSYARNSAMNEMTKRSDFWRWMGAGNVEIEHSPAKRRKPS